MSGCEHGIDAGAWVLGALDEREAPAFEAHLRGCAQCSDEVAQLRVAADALGLAADQVAPPAGLKERIMREVAPAAAPGGERRRRFLRPVSVAALAAALLAIGVAVGVLVSTGESTRTVQAKVTMRGASATVRIAGDRAQLAVRGMPAPPRGHVYEVWVKRGDNPPEPAGTMLTALHGRGEIEVGDVGDVEAIMVTSEPASGSQAPTGRPVITAAL